MTAFHIMTTKRQLIKNNSINHNIKDNSNTLAAFVIHTIRNCEFFSGLLNFSWVSQAVRYHRTVVLMISKVNGETEILTPGRPEGPENFITITGHIDYVAVGTNFMEIGPGVSAPPIAEKYLETFRVHSKLKGQNSRTFQGLLKDLKLQFSSTKSIDKKTRCS